MVYRIYVEKKKELANEAGSLLNDLRSLLGIGGLKGLRVLNRYDAEGISRELFDHAVKTVFSEPQVDIASERPDLTGATVFASSVIAPSYRRIGTAESSTPGPRAEANIAAEMPSIRDFVNRIW